MGVSRRVLVVIAGGTLALITGCTSYTNVPGPGIAPTQQDPNARQASGAVQTALVWAVRRHPVQGRYILNLPVGTSTETAGSIAARLGPNAVVPGAEPIADPALPTYHITRVWIRFSEAKVDVVYPMTDGQGERIQRGVTVWLNGGIGPWRVSRGQYWAPGTVPIPPVWVPIPQAELDALADARERAAEARDNADLPEANEPADSPASAEDPPAPAEDGEGDEAVIPLEDPAPEPEAPGNDGAGSGSVYREVPADGG